MTYDDWLAECARRISISEGVRLARYADSFGIPTVGVGYNLQRGTGPLCAIGIGPSQAQAICDGNAQITEDQALALLRNDLAASVNGAKDSVPDGLFDSMTDARRFVITDLVYNLGAGMWTSFQSTRGRIAAAQQAKNNNKPNAHDLFIAAGEALASSAYYQQTGNRAKRNVAMLVQGTWCDANGDGSDILPQPIA